MWRRGKDFWRKSGESGATLPFVICAGALLIAFALALTYTAGLMLANANRKLKEERCRQLAKSFANVLDEELLINTDVPADTAGGFRSFANQFLNKDIYSEFNADNPDTVYHYVLPDGAGDYGDIEIRLRKGKDVDEDVWQTLNYGSGSGSDGTNEGDGTSGGTGGDRLAQADFGTVIEQLEKVTFQYYTLTVDVIAEYDGISYQYTTEYVRKDTYSLEYRYREDGQTVVWDATNNCWKIGNTSGKTVNLTSGDEIEYRYKTAEDPKTTRFELVHEERGIGETEDGTTT